MKVCKCCTIDHFIYGWSLEKDPEINGIIEQVWALKVGLTHD